MGLVKKIIQITIKLFSGLHSDSGIGGYDPEEGVVMMVKAGTRVGKIAKEMGLPDYRNLAYFVGGIKAGHRARLKDGDELVCLRPSAGG
jgi:hypothetical protein